MKVVKIELHVSILLKGCVLSMLKCIKEMKSYSLAFLVEYKLIVNNLRRVQTLTHISLASFSWDIGKQNSPRCDAAKRGIPSGAILFADMNLIEK